MASRAVRLSKQLVPAGFWRTRFGGRVAANASRFPPRDPVREAGARTDSAFSHGCAHRRIPCAAPARFGPFVDEHRVVVAMEAVVY